MRLTHLWKNRVKPKLFTKPWLKVWAKRVLNMPGLFRISLRRTRYKARGAVIGNLTVLENLHFNGPAHRLSIGERSFLGAGVHLSLHEKITIGDRVVINNGVHLLTASHDTEDIGWCMYAKPIVIEDYAWIATKAIILPGVRIGKGAVVGAGAVVSRDIPNFAVAAGNPARIIGQRIHELEYSPVDLCAPFEAWTGKNMLNVDINKEFS